MASDGSPQHFLRILRVLTQRGDDLRRGHGFVLRVPAVIIGDHGDSCVANLRFTRQPRFRHVGHADHFEAKLPMHFRLGQRGKLWPFDADIRSAAMHFDGFMNASVRQYARQLAAGRMRKRHMSNNSFSEKGRDAILGPVKELIRNEKFSRPQIFLE